MHEGFLIQDQPIFQNFSKNKQAPVHNQLIIVLKRLGCDGIDREALLFGKSFGSIKKYTDHFKVVDFEDTR